MLGITYHRKCEILQTIVAKKCGILIGINQASNFCLWLEIKHNITCGVLNGRFRIYHTVFHKEDDFCHVESLPINTFKKAFKLYCNDFPLFNYMH